ncbi:hypothetical protein FPZ43_03710 [Mucilaginibacter pallidiroseus]|uniref:DUF308 domain-containing protein n=1 Tax=Mucilaginibacter pallidiroseus TaxID=2599295 RepID=A0A563UJN1_9SPHI|nr:hypothetical protein [Mucilaginibacter pallidiroseus]TWR31590.1 hypothetical protein FPZ43_03710 [Mucilaginibacter pallidiroseus]
MESTYKSNTAISGPTAATANSLRNLYFIRAAFSITWVILVALFSKTSPGFASILLIIYPAWDIVGTFLDIRANPNALSKTPQYINVAISTITTIAVAIALQTGVPQALIVFGAWAILTGLIQLILGLNRKKILGGQWPMIISGGQSMLGGTSFIVLANDPTKGIGSLAGYAAFGAFYYLLSAFRLNKSAAKTTANN